MSILVLSPHLDDAALSIPMWIAGRTTDTRVIVLTVFSAGDATHAIRRAEDIAALTTLGAQPLHLGLHDAPFRRHIPRDFEHLILTPLASDDPDAAHVHHTLLHTIEQLAPREILLPLAVGEHIDHRIVHALHTSLHHRLGFYADRPYADIEHALQTRLAKLGATLDGRTMPPTSPAAFLASAHRAPHITAYLPAHDRERALQTLAAPLTNPTPPTSLHLHSEHHELTAAQRARAITAVRAYTSQLPDLFGDPEAVPYAYASHRERIFWRAD